VGLAAAIAASDAVQTWMGRGGFASGPLLVLVGLVPLWLVLAHSIGLYHLAERKVDQTFVDELGPVFLVTTVWLWLSLMITAVLSSGATELLGPAVVWVVAIISILAARATARRIARHRSWFRRKVVLIGDREGTDRVAQRILRHLEWGLDVVAMLHVDGSRVELDTLEGGLITGSETIECNQDDEFATHIASEVSELNVDRAILTGGSGSLSERTDLARLLAERGRCVDYVYGEPESLYTAAVLYNLEGLPVLSVQPTRLSRGSAAMKRVLDLIVSAAGLILLSPLFAVAAIGIRLGSPGPVFFRQARIGKAGREFSAIKFRTMVDGADSMRADVRDQSIHANGQGMLKLRDDPRITPFGAKLRRWSIDELPQLWNVLRGDMSLVGPRPLPLDEALLVRGHFEMRNGVRPGITGTWQTHGRSDIPFEDMVKLDYAYVAGWSMAEDFRLLLRTAAVVAQGRGTY
jgi:exopolysaccharide biosynthesis polyprenyl glycosylphosphotransferase